MTTTVTNPPDLEAVKRRQQQMWASGDYSAVAARIVPVAERLVDAADLRSGWRVLDVATGSGNAALAAARLGCEVVGVDYVPSLLERARARAEAEKLEVELVEGDAEALPFEDASFDAVISVFGSMFAPDHDRTAAELARVCRPGGTIAVASWTPGGFIGQLLRTVSVHVPPPAGVASPLLWGSDDHLRRLFSDAVSSLEVRERVFTFRHPSPQAFVDFFRESYGPTERAFAALDGPAREELASDLLELARSHDRLRDGGSIAIPATYAEALATRR
jgi:SAM-dependent methyltransferase